MRSERAQDRGHPRRRHRRRGDRRGGARCCARWRRRCGGRSSCTHFDWGAERWLRDGTTLPEGAIEDLRDHYAAILFGALGDPRVPEQVHARDILLGLRFQLDLYINLRPVQAARRALDAAQGQAPAATSTCWCSARTPRGCTPASAATSRRARADEIAINEDVNTRKGVERILRAAFEAARGRRKKRVHERQGQRADLRARAVAARRSHELKREYPDIEASHLYVDVAAMEMVRAPERFDVIVTSNMFGDILTDLGAAIVGGLGLAASGNIHPGRCSLFEPVHGSAPDIAGKGVANPLGAISSMAMMLEHLGETTAAARVQAAVARVVADGAVTRDLGGALSTSACGDWWPMPSRKAA